MTKNDFQKRYHYYEVDSEIEARKEADIVNKEGIENDSAVAIKLGKLGWCLMLKSAAKFAKNMKIIPYQQIK